MKLRLPAPLEIAASPFAHAVIDDPLSSADLASLQGAFVDEPRARMESEIYSHERGTSPPLAPALRAFCDGLGAHRELLTEAFGSTFSFLDGAAYLYRRGDHLLPHSDRGHGRAVAYVFYLSGCDRGGELQLFDCTVREGEIVRTRPARRIAPRPNRLVLFAVAETALHEVREVLEGSRASVAGWLYR